MAARSQSAPAPPTTTALREAGFFPEGSRGQLFICDIHTYLFTAEGPQAALQVHSILLPKGRKRPFLPAAKR